MSRTREVVAQERRAGSASSVAAVRRFLERWRATGRGDHIVGVSDPYGGYDLELTAHHLDRLIIAASNHDEPPVATGMAPALSTWEEVLALEPGTVIDERRGDRGLLRHRSDTPRIVWASGAKDRGQDAFPIRVALRGWDPPAAQVGEVVTETYRLAQLPASARLVPCSIDDGKPLLGMKVVSRESYDEDLTGAADDLPMVVIYLGGES